MGQISIIGCALLATSHNCISTATSRPGLTGLAFTAALLPYAKAFPVPPLPPNINNAPYVLPRAYSTSEGRPVILEKEHDSIDNHERLDTHYPRSESVESTAQSPSSQRNEGGHGFSSGSRPTESTNINMRRDAAPDRRDKAEAVVQFREEFKHANSEQQPGHSAMKTKNEQLRRQSSDDSPSRNGVKAKRSVYGDRWTRPNRLSDDDRRVKVCFEDELFRNQSVMLNINGTIEECKHRLNVTKTSFGLDKKRPKGDWFWDGPATSLPKWWKRPPPEARAPRFPFKRPHVDPRQHCPQCPRYADWPHGPEESRLPLRPASLAVPDDLPRCACLPTRKVDAIGPLSPNQPPLADALMLEKVNTTSKSKLRKRDNNQSMENPKYGKNDYHWFWDKLHNLKVPDWWIMYEGDQAMPKHPTWSPFRDEDVHDQRTEPKYGDTIPNATNLHTSEPEARYPRHTHYKQFMRHPGEDLSEGMPDNEFVKNQKEEKIAKKKKKLAEARNKKLGWKKDRKKTEIRGWDKRDVEHAGPENLDQDGKDTLFDLEQEMQYFTIDSPEGREKKGNPDLTRNQFMSIELVHKIAETPKAELKSIPDPPPKDGHPILDPAGDFTPGTSPRARPARLSKRSLKTDAKKLGKKAGHQLKEAYQHYNDGLNEWLYETFDEGGLKKKWKELNGQHDGNKIHWWEKLNGGNAWIEWNQGPWMAAHKGETWMTGKNIYVDFGQMPKPWPEIDKEHDWRKWFDWGPNAPPWIKGGECPRGYDGPEALCWYKKRKRSVDVQRKEKRRVEVQRRKKRSVDGGVEKRGLGENSLKEERKMYLSESDESDVDIIRVGDREKEAERKKTERMTETPEIQSKRRFTWNDYGWDRWYKLGFGTAKINKHPGHRVKKAY